MTNNKDNYGNAASLVHIDEERLRRTLYADKDCKEEDDDDDDDDDVEQAGGCCDDEDDEDDDTNNFLLLSPTRVRQYAHTLLVSSTRKNNSMNNSRSDKDDEKSITMDTILHRIQNNPLPSWITALVVSSLIVIIAIIICNSTNSSAVSTGLDDYCKNFLRKRIYPTFPVDILFGIATPDQSSLVTTGIDDDYNTKQKMLGSQRLKPPYTINDFQLRPKNSLTYWEEVVYAIDQTQQYLDQIDNETIQQQDEHVDRYNSTTYNNNFTIFAMLDEVRANMTTSWGPCYPRAILPHFQDNGHHNHHNRDYYHLRHTRNERWMINNWTNIIQTYSSCRNISSCNDNIIYPIEQTSNNECISSSKKNEEDSSSAGTIPFEGMCRPSFLIIGQGKCGTSSLYHYLNGHPRILPAKEKQIDYFNYHKFMPLSWYYSHFPTIESFLGSGALMTGEASPGYMPYPSVVEAIIDQLSSSWKPVSSQDDEGREQGFEEWKAHIQSLPKIIALVRNPIERAKSSYKYNYVEPAIAKLKSGSGITASGKRLPGKRSDEYYRAKHLFSLEELAYAELEVLKECLKPGGRGESWTYNEYRKRPEALFYESIQRRSHLSPTSPSNFSSQLIYLDEACYNSTKSRSVPRTQWMQLALEHPNKTFTLPNLHLVQSIIGRGMYILPLEWWYEVFSHPEAKEEMSEHIKIVCTEDLAERPESTLEDVANFLGLPHFDFTNVTNVGWFNVGGHRGYDTITKLAHEDDERSSDTLFLNPNHKKTFHVAEELEENEKKNAGDPLLTISDAFLNELIHFYAPFNERLFGLIGKRCPW